MFALLPPSPENLATFAAWAVTARRLPVFLAEHARGALKADVSAGATLFIPGAETPRPGTLRSFSPCVSGCRRPFRKSMR